MSVRLKLALTIFATGLLTALLVIATVVFAFQRFENETASVRRRSGFVTTAMISAASSVVALTTASTAPSAGRAKLLRRTSQRSAGSCCVCRTRYR